MGTYLTNHNYSATYWCESCSFYNDMNYDDCHSCLSYQEKFLTLVQKKYKCPTCKRNKSIFKRRDCYDCGNKKEKNRMARENKKEANRLAKENRNKRLKEEKEANRLAKEKEKEKKKKAKELKKKAIAERLIRIEEERKRVELINRLTKTTRKIEID